VEVTNTIERPAPQDRLQLAVDVGPAPMHVGVVIVLDGAVDVESVRRRLGERVRGVPRLRRRLVPTPVGCGGPVWVDDASFDVRRHVVTAACPAPGDENALLGLAAQTLTRPLPPSRPLWSALLVTDVEGGRCALVLVVHHLLADGIGGLAVLGGLLDGGAAAPADDGFPRSLPGRGQLAADAWGRHWRAVRGVGRAAHDAAAGLRELGGRPPAAPRTSWNRPTGPRRRLATAHVDLSAAATVARAGGATVNDVLLAAVGRALGAASLARGEWLDSAVVSVPVAARRSAGPADPGNAVGAMPVSVPTCGDARHRLRAVSAATRARKSARRGTSTAVLVPLFATLARVGAFRWFIRHQRMVNTFVTNVRGPDRPVRFLGVHVVALVPLSVVPGNVTVAFTALSYAGDLVVTVVADPDRVPDLDLLAQHLQAGLDELAGLS
jgi:diacylglycerol O-acyltransferase / wax synthase